MLKIQLIHNVCKLCLHKYSTVSSGHVLEKLTSRSLVRVSGYDAPALLQGLITNDIRHLEHGVGSMFAMFLNSKGRVLYDTIIYRVPEESTYYLEVDKQVADIVQKHLNIYRLRRKIDVNLIDDQFTVWAHFKPDDLNVTLDKTENVSFKEIGNQKLLIFKDPRLVNLGARILVPTDCNSKLPEYFNSASSPSYKWYRYRLGVGEGIDELPVGNCFPLEVNCDYLHGVSFHKGCYIGQELTARVHHTGVVRKRLMPLVLLSTFTKTPAKDEVIKSGDANLGKLRGFEADAGLGLLRIEKALNAKGLIVNDIVVKTSKPNWWPVEAPKEKMSANF